MELKDFISNSVQQIAQGILEAQARCEGLDVLVNPEKTLGSGS